MLVSVWWFENDSYECEYEYEITSCLRLRIIDPCSQALSRTLCIELSSSGCLVFINCFRCV